MSSNYTMRLKPLSDESLPIIEVIDSGVPICLGRNLTTQIKSKGMSRKLCDIEVTCAGEMFLMMRKNPDEHFLQINGMKVFELPGVRIPILKGSIVSLDKMYRYEVDLDKSNTETGLNNVVSNNIDGGSESILNQELICSICLEIIVESTVINPCGHVYCFSCIEHYRRRYDDCPNCRCSIQSLIRVQYTDNIIYDLIKKGEFNEDDTMHYLKRNGKNLSQDEVSFFLPDFNSLFYLLD